MRFAAAVVGLLLLAGCENKPKLTKVQSDWLSVVMLQTNEGNIGSQLAFCKNPPVGAPAEGLRNCAEFVGPAAMKLARPGVENGGAAITTRGPTMYCDWMLDALAITRRDRIEWKATQEWTAPRCCRGPIDNDRKQCEAVGIQYDDSK